MVELWKELEGKIDPYRFEFTLKNLSDFVDVAKNTRNEMAQSFEKHTGQKQKKALEALKAQNLAKNNVFNVRHFGAKGNGLVNDAQAINTTIEACSNAGGGTVFIPSGIYTTGSIH
jgi:polygalacturonase